MSLLPIQIGGIKPGRVMRPVATQRHVPACVAVADHLHKPEPLKQPFEKSPHD